MMTITAKIMMISATVVTATSASPNDDADFGGAVEVWEGVGVGGVGVDVGANVTINGLLVPE